LHLQRPDFHLKSGDAQDKRKLKTWTSSISFTCMIHHDKSVNQSQYDQAYRFVVKTARRRANSRIGIRSRKIISVFNKIAPSLDDRSPPHNFILVEDRPEANFLDLLQVHASSSLLPGSCDEDWVRIFTEFGPSMPILAPGTFLEVISDATISLGYRALGVACDWRTRPTRNISRIK
jgi:hypothetical protein